MQLTLEEVNKRIQSKRVELVTYGQQAQNEINNLQQSLQNKVREAQKRVDNLEGEIVALGNLKAEIEKDAPPVPPTPAQAAPKSESK